MAEKPVRLSPECERLLAEVNAIDWAAFAEDDDEVECYGRIPETFGALVNAPSCSTGMRQLWDAACIDISYAGMFRDSHVLLVGFLLRLLPLEECPDKNNLLRWLGGVSLGVSYGDPAGDDSPNLVNRLLMQARPTIARLLRHPDPVVRAVAASLLLGLCAPNNHSTPPPMPDPGPIGHDILAALAETKDENWRAISLTKFHFLGTAEHVPDLVSRFIDTDGSPSVKLAAAVSVAHLAKTNSPAPVAKYLRSVLGRASYKKCNYGTEIMTKQIPGWVRGAVDQLSQDAEPSLEAPLPAAAIATPLRPLAPSAAAVAFRERVGRLRGFDWATATDPDTMLDWMRQLEGQWTNNRKSHLFGVACCRRLWHRLTKRARRIVEMVESLLDDADRKSRSQKLDQLREIDLGGGFRPAEGTADEAVRELYGGLYSPRGLVRWHRTLEVLGLVAAATRRVLGAEEAVAQAQLLRCLYGHPPAVPAIEPGWRTEAVIALARRAYDDREESVLPILADALEEAGCTTQEVLTHCRGPGPHTRACWAVELALGRE